MLSAYTYQIVFKPTQSHGNADGLSCLPLPETDTSSVPGCFNICQIQALPVTCEAVQTATRRDPVLSNDDGVEALTPGHFLIGRPIESLPNGALSYRSISLLRRWHLCQNIVHQFWTRWSTEYLTTLRRFAKWNHPSRNAREGNVVVLQEDGLAHTRWPLSRITKVYHGKDGLVRVVTVKTGSGTYRRPITKVTPLLPSDT